ncbi:MAG TPA: hypothetical protein VE077_08620 [Candidatus Methylomirabilis sp.]|nr:hypothetical protein [Candidatus Methylomirabilis sp.]
MAVVQIFCFLTPERLEPYYFIIHLYQLIPYLAILLLVVYGQQRWAYTIGPLVSVAWFGLAYMAGLLGSAVERVLTPESVGSRNTRRVDEAGARFSSASELCWCTTASCFDGSGT